MKSLFVVLLVAVAVTAQINPELYDQCISEVGLDDISPSDLSQVLLTSSDPPQDVKCFYKCLAVALGFMSGDDFKVDLKAVMKVAPSIFGRKDIKSRVAVCQKEKGSSDCDTAYQIAKCLLKGTTEL